MSVYLLGRMVFPEQFIYLTNHRILLTEFERTWLLWQKPWNTEQDFVIGILKSFFTYA